jgi:hypothetical protein
VRFGSPRHRHTAPVSRAHTAAVSRLAGRRDAGSAVRIVVSLEAHCLSRWLRDVPA